MKFKVKKQVEIEVRFIRITVPVRHDEEDIPNDFPLRVGDAWDAIVDIDTGMIHEWPVGQSGELSMKVCDEGVYELLDADRQGIALRADYVRQGIALRADYVRQGIALRADYVPNDVVPGSYGDYIELSIDTTGKIVNWPKCPDVSGFFKDDE